MAELTDDDLILGPVTYFKYPSSNTEYETENGFDINKVKHESVIDNNFDNYHHHHHHVHHKVKDEPNNDSLFDNDQCNDYVSRIEYPYYQSSDQNNYTNSCSSPYGVGHNNFPIKEEIKSEPIDNNNCRNEHNQLQQHLQQHQQYLQQQHPLHQQPQHSQMPSAPPPHQNIQSQNPYPLPMQNGDYYYNGWPMYPNHHQNYPHPHCYQQPTPLLPLPLHQPFLPDNMVKKRGRKKKVKTELDDIMSGGTGGNNNYQSDIVQLLSAAEQNELKEVSVAVVKERRKHDRFNGMPEEEVSKRTLPDLLDMNLDIVVIGINPGLFAAYKGHHYAGPGNHFWKCLYLSGLVNEPLTADDDYKLLKVGIGFTNMVERATKGSSDLTRKEIRDGGQALLEKLQKYKPRIAVFNGKLIFEVFSGKKEFNFGRQPDLVDGTNTYMWVMPSSSARCAQLPRATDKVPYYAALKKFRDFLKGDITDLDDNEVVFQYCKLKTYPRTGVTVKKEIKEEFEEFYEEDFSNSSLRNDSFEQQMSPIPQPPRGRKKSKTEDTNKISETPPDGIIVKKKRGRPKKIRPEIVTTPVPVPVPVENSNSPVNTSSSTSKYFPSEIQQQQSASSSPNPAVQKNISPSPSYQHQFSSPSDGGYCSQNSMESAFSSHDFHPSEIQSHLRSFLPSSKPEPNSPNE